MKDQRPGPRRPKQGEAAGGQRPFRPAKIRPGQPGADGAPAGRSGQPEGGWRRGQENPRPPKRGSPGGGGGGYGGGEPLYGVNPVLQALKANRRRMMELAVREGAPNPRQEEAMVLAHQLGLKVAHLPPHQLEDWCGSSAHQGLVLRCGPLEPLDEDLLMPDSARLVVALDEVEDPQNFGAIVRNCAAFGADGLVVVRRHRAPFSPAASKASAGMLETFPVYEAANLSRFLANWKKAGGWVAGTAERGDTPLRSYQPPGALVVVLGNEGKGMRQLVASHCDALLSIPGSGQVSLNVAAASAVLLFSLTKP